MRADDRADGLPGEFGSGVYQGDDVHLKTEHKTTSTKRNLKKHMSTLVVVGYDDPYKAEEVRLKLRKLQSEYLLFGCTISLRSTCQS